MLCDKTIWILEDDPGCQFVYQEIFDFRYNVRFFDSLSVFQQALQDLLEGPSLIIADLKLADGCFINFLSQNESKKLMKYPFLVVSSSDDIDALRFCFNEGAIDYLTKPFRKTEVIVKIENILSKGSYFKSETAVYFNSGDNNKEFSNLTLKEGKILALMMNSPEKTVSREDLYRHLWNSVTVHPKTLDVHLYNLRRKINANGMSIENVSPGRWTLLRDGME